MADLDLSPPSLNLTAYAGDDRSITVTVTDAAGQPVTLVSPFLCHVKGSADQATPDATLTFTSAEPATGVGVLVVDGDSTEALLALPGATTRSWVSGGAAFSQKTWLGVWDLQMGSDANNDVLTLMAGTFTVLGDVSREGP